MNEDQERRNSVINDVLTYKLMKAVNFLKTIPEIEKEIGKHVFRHYNLVSNDSHAYDIIAHCSPISIEINTKDLELMPWEELIETLLHEIAHIRYKHHGPAWRNHFNSLLAILTKQVPDWPGMAELADAGDLKSPEVTPHVGSNPTARIIK